MHNLVRFFLRRGGEIEGASQTFNCFPALHFVILHFLKNIQNGYEDIIEIP